MEITCRLNHRFIAPLYPLRRANRASCRTRAPGRAMFESANNNARFLHHRSRAAHDSRRRRRACEQISRAPMSPAPQIIAPILHRFAAAYRRSLAAFISRFTQRWATRSQPAFNSNSRSYALRHLFQYWPIARAHHFAIKLSGAWASLLGVDVRVLRASRPRPLTTRHHYLCQAPDNS